MTHEMKLRQEPFDYIVKGIKTIELRLNDEKRRLINVGDKIRFSLIDGNSQTVETTVIKLHRFSSFKELFLTDLFSKCGCDGMTIDAAVASMKQYYTEDQEEKYGVIGIEIIVG